MCDGGGEEYDGGPSKEEWTRLWKQMTEGPPPAVTEVYVGQEVFQVITDPDDPDCGLRIGVD